MPGRPRTPIGTWGKIYTSIVMKNGEPLTRNGKPVWKAETYFRERDGSLPKVARRGSSATAAENRLKERLAVMASEVRGKEINLDTRLARVAELWMQDLDSQAALGDIEPSSARQFKSYTKNWVIPACGQLQMRELSVGAFESLIERVRNKRSYETASSVKSVLSLLCDFAIRHKALEFNYGRQMKRLKRSGDQKEVRGLTKDERLDLLAKLDVFVKSKAQDSLGRQLGTRGQVWSDLPDLMHAFLSTGGRIGEMCALLGSDYDRESRTLRISAHHVRDTAAGVVRKSYRKGTRKVLTLQVPEWSTPMWARRKLAAGTGSMFTSSRGGPLDPETLGKRLREALDACGYPWVTSHSLGRKTVAKVINEANLDSGVVADQLGNTRTVAERHYIPSKAANGQAVRALEEML